MGGDPCLASNQMNIMRERNAAEYVIYDSFLRPGMSQLLQPP